MQYVLDNTTKYIKLLLLSWKESLKIFFPDNLKTFLLITLKSIINSYSTIFGNIFITILLIILTAAAIYFRFSLSNDYVHILLFSFIIVICFCATRPSVGNKDTRYFVKSLLVTIPVIILIFFLRYLEVITNNFILSVIPISFIMVYILFLLDSQCTIIEYLKAIFRALCMIIFNYPFFIIVLLFFNGIMKLTSMLISFIMPELDIIFYYSFFTFLYYPVYSCIITNFYTKRLHEQFGLYYQS